MTEPLTTILSSLAGAVLVIFFLRLWVGQVGKGVENIKKRMNCFETAQHACQLENAKSFATKQELKELDIKVDAHEGRIIKLESKQQ